MKTYLSRTTLAAAALLTLGGCAVVDHEKAKQNTERVTNKTEAQYETAMQPPVATRVSESGGVWVNKRSNLSREDRLPAIFRSTVGMSFGPRASLKDVTGLIARETGLRFGFAPDVVKEVDSPMLNAGFSSDEELGSLLSRLTAQANMSWRYSEGAVEVYRFDTTVYEVAALAGTRTLNSTTSNRNVSGAGTTASTSGQDSKYAAKLDFWSGLKDDLKTLVQGGTYAVSESNGTVTVTATAQVQAKVASYMKDLNAKRMRQVALEVRAYTVDVTSGRDFGMSWDLVYSNLQTGLGLTGTTPAPVAIGLGALGAVLGPNSSSKWANSSVIANVLSTMGNTVVAAESSQMVLHGESVSLNSLREISYLAEVTATPVLNGEALTGLKPATVTEGFAMTLTPTIVGGDYVQIAGAIDLAYIDGFDEQGSGGQRIKTPRRSTRALPIGVGLRSGETYIMAMRENASSISGSGVAGTATAATLLGGQHGSKDGRKTVVVTVTPYIINATTN